MRLIILFVFSILCVQTIRAQNDSTYSKLSSITDISSKTITGLQKQYSGLQSKLAKQSAKLLTKMQRKEGKVQSKLNSIDSTKAQQLFTDDVKQHYQNLQSNLSKTTDKLKQFPLKEYIPGIDSVQTSLNFLLKNPNLPTDKLEQLQGLSTKLKGLQEQLQKANDIQAFIREREAALKEQLLNSGLAKQLTGINKQVYYYQNKQVYYYQTQIAEYKSLLNDKEKLKEKLLETVRTLPAFQKFWQKNSYLAALFPMQGSPVMQSSAGLQTRASVQNILAQRFSGINTTSGNILASPQQYVQPGIDQAQAQVNQLKNKLSRLTEGGNSDMTQPDFKPNDQKTKTFLQRLQYGFNIQSQSTQFYMPATSDLALTAGYKLSDTKEFGIGMSYKMGWGNGFKDIHISSEGIGLRSYVDIKAKGSIWLSGGFEYNYLSNFRNLQELHNNVDVWQRSALLGLSKKYKIGKNKEGNIQLLYDFLYNKQTPPGQAFKFRLGYSL
jgi:hypothetical protein